MTCLSIPRSICRWMSAGQLKPVWPRFLHRWEGHQGRLSNDRAGPGVLSLVSRAATCGGFVYLGRKDVVALPAAGLVYTPTDDLKFDLMFPKPRAGYRYHHDLERERWVYCSGELGGGSWAVRRINGDDDVATYRDFQLLVGIEHKEPGVINWQLEGGYAFSRRVEYISKTGDTDLPSTAVLRVVLSY